MGAGSRAVAQEYVEILVSRARRAGERPAACLRDHQSRMRLVAGPNPSAQLRDVLDALEGGIAALAQPAPGEGRAGHPR
ncbi:hypothetical protein [Methylobacterium nigriterrae]|uniref:hypothetical protein n=1 Tax=Methylobacterium nigriterrae TaxID=3127512 RepID=UPI003013BC90